ncbi:hypothetical protein [Candidatus Chloroploca mongolica]|uniref:hypothetical protein n=1 Tax=Candidatus Chloroploca mongolica TaxID=2528176 RepID=UPI0035316C53
MNVQLNKNFPKAGEEPSSVTIRNAERLILFYWLISGVLGVIFLWDWLTAWNVPVTFSHPWFVLYLILSFGLTQVLYLLVARHDGRQLHWGATAIFAIGNGIAETLAFALIYRLGEVIGTWLIGLVAPSLAALGGLMMGIIFFTIYGGLIHGLFWLRILPPHLDDSPRSQAIRKNRPIAEIVLVLGWSLCLWWTRDIWTVIFFHILVDIGLMVLVRPPLFGARPASVPVS